MDIVIADDLRDGRDLLRALLEGAGHRVREAEDGDQALELIRAEPPDLVVSDILMPNMDGLSLCKALKADPRLRRIPFVVYTATFTSPEDERLALDVGASRFIVKPEEPGKLLAAVEAVLVAAGAGTLPVPGGPTGDAAELDRRHEERLTNKLTKKIVELDAYRQTLSTLMSNLPGMAYRCRNDPDGTLEFVSEGSLPLTGYSPGALIGQRDLAYAALMHPEDRPRLDQEVQRALAEDQPYQIEYRIRRRDGEERWVSEQGRRVSPKGVRPEILEGFVSDISERKRAQTERDLSEGRLRLALESAQVGLWDWNLKTGQIYLSPVWAAMIGEAPGALGDTLEVWTARVHPDDLPGATAAVQASLKDPRRPYEAVYRFRHADGHYLWHIARGRVLTDGAGAPERFIGTQVDITETQEIQEALRASEERFRVAAKNASDLVFEWDLGSDRLDWYGPVDQALGLPARDMARTMTDWLGRIHGDDRPRLEARVRRCREQGESVDMSYRVRHLDGSWRIWTSRGSAVSGPDGRPARLVGTCTDVTERVAWEERLRQSAAVFESTAEGVTICGTDGSILDVNRAFSEITGYPREEVLGRNPRLLKSGRHDESFYQVMWRSIQDTGEWRGEVWNRRKDGSIYPEWLTISTVRDAEGEATHYVGVFSDISQIKRSEERLAYLAHHDPLTELPNRLLLGARMQHALKRAARTRSQVAVLMVDLDRFKNVNDSWGHPAGDRLLREAGERLVHCVRLDDTVARVGGDEFVLLLENIADPANAGTVAEKILLGFSEPFELAGVEVIVTPSIGISLYPRDGADVDSLLKNADAALYRAKDQGRNTFAFYTQELTRAVLERVLLESHLRRARERGELRLVYQPQLDMASGELIGVEALVRWEHPQQGIIAPFRFIPLAEETGIILSIGEWVLATACAQIHAWRAAGRRIPRMAVNVAGHQIQRSDLFDTVSAALQASGLPPQHLEIEITEGFFLDHSERTVATMDRLRALGVRIAIDDFGTGYSSLAYLKRLPVDKLKIDQSFVRDIPADPNDAAIIRAVIAMAASLGLQVIAEGVETDEQARFLVGSGCREAQGYLFGRPMPAAELETWMDRRTT